MQKNECKKNFLLQIQSENHQIHASTIECPLKAFSSSV